MNLKELSRAISLITGPVGFYNRVLLFWAALLLVVGVGYLVHGSRRMFAESFDYRMHWIEERYVFRGKNPADIFARLEAEAHHTPIPNNGRDSSIDPDLGPADGAYPLWSYFTGTMFTWPSTFPAGRIYNGIFNLIVLAGMLAWTFKLADRENPLAGLALASSVLAVNSISTTFTVGQYGVQVLGALVAAYILCENRKWMWAGIFFGIAMVKLSIAAPFALVFLFKGQWKILVSASVYLMIGTLIIWPLVKTNPVEILSQMTNAAGHYEARGYSLNNLIERFGVEPQLAMKAAAILTLALALALMYMWRSSSLLTLYAIASVASRAWCYHRQYDNLVLLFLLIALGVAAWRTRSMLAIASYLVVGISLWCPGRLTDFNVWIIFQWVAWIEGLSALLFLERVDARLGGETTGASVGAAWPIQRERHPVVRG